MNETFSVGDMVMYTGPLAKKSLHCKVIKVMPVEHAHVAQNYRIRDSAEAFERAVPGFTLTRIEPTAAEQLFKS